LRYVTLSSGTRTIVVGIARNGGRIVRSAILPGNFTIPAVAYDSTAGRLPPDPRTLVLIQPRVHLPPTRTRPLLLPPSQLSNPTLIDLRGDFSFDAVSPNGAHIYLIQYTHPTDPTRSLVRSYDVKRWRLDPRPIVDPRDVTEKMRGNPVTRVMSADGRFAY